MNIVSLTERISYVPATEEPLSADVGIVRGKEYTWLFDVGSSREMATVVENLPEDFSKRKNIVISHFHPDHMANWNRISHEEVYQGKNTFGYTHEGMVVEEPLTLEDGIKLYLFPIPSSHAKGCLGLVVGEYAFLGDATYCTHKKDQAVYNAGLLLEQIRILETLPVKYFLLSHQKEFSRPKEKILAELREIYSRRKKDDPYIRVE